MEEVAKLNANAKSKANAEAIANADPSPVKRVRDDKREAFLRPLYGRHQRLEKSCRNIWLLFTTPTIRTRPLKPKRFSRTSTRSTARWLPPVPGSFVAGLTPVGVAKSLRAQPDGKVLITDGPYLETKEHIGGFWVLEAADIDEALAWGRKAVSPAVRRSRCARFFLCRLQHCRQRRPDGRNQIRTYI